MSPYTIADLRRGLTWAKSHPTARAYIPAVGDTMTGAEWRAWFRRCLDAKINRHLPARGRKDDPDWRAVMRRTARELNSRVVIRWLPHDLKARFGYRLEGHS